VTERTLHPSVAYRTAAPALRKRPYRPPPLRPYSKSLQEIAAPIALMNSLIDLVTREPKKKRGLFG
jgi:hypothetical protein